MLLLAGEIGDSSSRALTANDLTGSHELDRGRGVLAHL